MTLSDRGGFGDEMRFSSETRLAAPTKVTSSVGRPVREISEPGVPSSDQNFLYLTIFRGGVGVLGRSSVVADGGTTICVGL